MVSTRKKRNQQKRQFGQLNKTLNNFVNGNGTNVGVMENETLEQQNNDHYINPEKFVIGEVSACQNQV